MTACFVRYARSAVRSRGAWVTRSITDWNHATGIVKKYAAVRWHKDAAATAVMAKQSENGESVLEIQYSSAERKQRNRDVLELIGVH